MRIVSAFLLLGFATSSWGQGYSPADSIRHMTLSDDLEAVLVASEPAIRQPILVKCDDRGRLWTIQYLQYPNPAGLKRVKVDRWSRTQYDRVPLPPPDGPRGADKITILTDADGDGDADQFHDFLDGLNLGTGLAFGHDGVFVLQVPYLLFYPDRDRNDIPDGKPDVLLEGFGMEDAQALANHLTWGPDGWLYGVNGSTTTCRIRGIEFQQGCWRYHPITKAFELFCEGGSNTFGLTFDEVGELYYSTNGGPFVHAVQGGYYYKAFGKHGPLHNRHAQHYFGPVEVDQAPGGPPTGGTIYLADALGPAYRGRFIAGNFLGHSVSWWNVHTKEPTVSAAFGGILLDSHDTWFGPTDLCSGPDGCLYVSDFHDQRTAHPDPDANWDRSNGRIFKIQPTQKVRSKTFDIASMTSSDLVRCLTDSNHWWSGMARVELAARRDSSIVPSLRAMTRQQDRRTALEGLWALHVTNGLTDQDVVALAAHLDPFVRMWTVRLVGDQETPSGVALAKLKELASREDHPRVRVQLAATAKRLPAVDALAIIEALWKRAPDDADERTRWLTWWAIESMAVSHRAEIVDRWAREEWWSVPASRKSLLCLVRRYAAEGTIECDDACQAFLDSSGTSEREALEALRTGLAERHQTADEVGQGGLFDDLAVKAQSTPPTKSLPPPAGKLASYIRSTWEAAPDDLLALEVALRSKITEAEARARRLLQTSKDLETLPPFLTLMAQVGTEVQLADVEHLLDVDSPEVQKSVLAVLAKSDDISVTAAILARYGAFPSEIQTRARQVFLSRTASARTFLSLIDAGKIDAKDIPVGELRVLAHENDPKINELVRKHWGNIGPGTSEDRLATVRRLMNDLRASPGDAQRGKAIFAKACGACHRLFGEGNFGGPDLTTANRHDRAALLANIVDPSSVIRREYLAYTVQTTTGQVLSGVFAEQDAGSVTLLDANGSRTKLARSEIEEITEQAVSLMPERLLDSLTPAQVRDLFAFLEQK